MVRRNLTRSPLSQSKSPRLFYGARFFNQAVPIVHNESPLVRTLADGQNKTFERLMGESLGAVRSKHKGRVLAVDPDGLDIQDDLGQAHRIDLYNNFPFNRLSAIHNTPLVKPGDQIEPDQILARSDYTDDQGDMAMGLNARVGIVPYLGHSLDDAIVISESAARRLTSRQTYTESQDFDHETRGGIRHFTSLFPTRFTQDQLKNLTEDGVPKPGAILHEGDPYILATRPKMMRSNEGSGSLTRAMRHARQDASLTWDHSDPAKVVDVVKTGKGWKVMLQTETPAKDGDKIVFRPGSKHIISKILPDEHMPRTADGQPLELLLNPLSIPSRANANIVFELLLGKAARKLGKPIEGPGFNAPDQQWHEQVLSRLEEAGLSDVEDVFDPLADRKLERPITVGEAYVMKLHHMASVTSGAEKPVWCQF